MTERELFTAALLRASRAARRAFVAEACGADAALRARVLRLLDLHDGPDGLFARRPADLLDALSDPTATRADDTAAADTTDAAAAAGQLAPHLTPAARPDALGRLGHYDVLSVLGVGGYGIVVKAFDDVLHRVVAIKVLAPHLAVTSPPRKRFLREARAAGQVRHEHVVQIYAVEEEPVPFLVMEFVEGRTLQQQLDADGPLPAAEVVRLGRQIVLGLAAAHDQGLVHRDVKPANVLIEAGVERRAKLTDFGLARAGDDASLTQSGVIAGTPMYMAPEQARGAALDHRTDLFSLGSVLYTMATGRPPFRAPNALAVLKRVAEDTPRPVREIIADVPEGLCAVIRRLMEKDLAARFPTARAAADALDRCLTDPAPAWANSRSRRRRAAARLAAVLAVAAGVAVAVWPRDGDAGTGAGPDAPAARAGADANRGAAERVLFASGSVWVNGEDREIKAEDDLPQGRLSLTRVSLDNHKRVDNLLAPLRGLPGVTRLDLSFSSLSDAGLAHLRDCTGLRCLCMHGTEVTDAGLAHLKRLDRLEEIGGNFAKLTDNGLALLADHHPALFDIGFTNTAIGDAGLEHLTRLKGLRKLYVGGTRMTDVGMAHVARHTGLVKLDLWGVLITDAGVARLSVLTNLRWLRLRSMPITDASLASLAHCKALTWLDVGLTKVTAQGLADFHAAVPACEVVHDGGTIPPAK